VTTGQITVTGTAGATITGAVSPDGSTFVFAYSDVDGCSFNIGVKR
jgi:hypothetical protein